MTTCMKWWWMSLIDCWMRWVKASHCIVCIVVAKLCLGLVGEADRKSAWIQQQRGRRMDPPATSCMGVTESIHLYFRTSVQSNLCCLHVVHKLICAPYAPSPA